MTKPHQHDCPVAQMLNLVGDHWTWLIIREAFFGVTRFNGFQQRTGIAKNLLADRLERLVLDGIFEKKDIGQKGTRYAYGLTAKGKALQPVLIAMLQWGNTHIYGAGNEPLQVVDKKTGRPLAPLQYVATDGRPVPRSDLAIVKGAGAQRSPQTQA